jgi:phosphoglycerate dehydrogenase-like enzyme
MKVLWPQHFWGGDRAPELEGAGEGLETEFVGRFHEVTDAQWRSADALVGPSPPLEALAKLEKCRIYVKPAVGFDDVDLKAWGEAGIPVCNCPDYGTREVADHAIALMLTLTKSIAFHDESLRADPRANWRPALNPYGQRLSDCTFGVVGLGRIGTAAALRAKAFDMDVVFFDPYLSSGVELSLGIRRADSLEELMGQSHVVSVHAPLNDETRNLIGAGAFAAARRGVIVINTARGPIVDIDALHDAMKEGQVLAAGLDVLPEEPASLQRPLIAAWQANEDWIRHRLLVTPHSAFFTPQSLRDIRRLSARTAGRFLRDGRLENCVNAAFLKPR